MAPIEITQELLIILVMDPVLLEEEVVLEVSGALVAEALAAAEQEEAGRH